MKICVLGDASKLHTKRWVDYFVGRGWEVHLISLEENIGTKAYEHILSSKVKIKWLKYLLASRKISNKIEKIAPDIINAHFVPNYGLIGALVDKHPLVISCWGSDVLEPPEKGFLQKLRIKFTLSRADLITTDAKMLTDEVVGFGIARDRILTVPMGIDRTVFNLPSEKISCEQVRAREGVYKFFPSDLSEVGIGGLERRGNPELSGEGILAFPLIVHLRALEPIYNPELFVKAIALVIHEEKVKILMRFDGSMKNKIANLASKLGVKIGFVPWLSQIEVAKILKSATIYVSTSLSDSTSVTLLEAMACGAFPIVSDITGNREWITDCENGYLVPIDNPKYLADRIVAALHNSRLLKDAGLRNAEIINEHCVWENNMSEIEKAFMNLI